MNSAIPLLLAFSIGIVAGLRSLTAPAVVAWATYLGWINLSTTRLSFMGTGWAVGILTVLALIELVADQLPTTPARTSAFPLVARLVTGSFTGACIAAAGAALLWLGALAGATGAVLGAFAGYRARVGLVRGLHLPDLSIAIPEDLLAIGLGLLVVSRF